MYDPKHSGSRRGDMDQFRKFGRTKSCGFVEGRGAPAAGPAPGPARPSSVSSEGSGWEGR